MSSTKIAILFLVYSTSNYIYADNTTVTPLGVIDIPKTTLSNESASSFFAAKDTYGMRSNAVVAAFQANPQKSFNFPILGFDNLIDIANYSDRDSVSLYADNTAPSLKPWQIINDTTFGKNVLISKEIDESKIKIGMILDTDENEKWSTYILKVEKNKLITAGWINSKTKKTGLPKNGTRVFINPITKIWATNFNIFLQKNSLANNAVIQENGLINAKFDTPNGINGIDTVVLPQSEYGGMTAYLARNAVSGFKQRWRIGFMSKGSEINFISTDSLISSPLTGFLEDSNAKNGFVFNGKNQNNSIIWLKDNRTMAAIDPNGLISKIGYKTITISEDTQMSDEIGRYIIDNKQNILLKLPLSKNVFNGYTIKISKVSSNSVVTFETEDSKVKINGKTKETITGEQWNKEAFFDGKNWFIL